MKRKTYRKFRALLAATVVSAVAASGVHAEDLASGWVEGFNNKARLLAGKAGGGPLGNTPRNYAGIEISMASGFKTYWRNPGEAGGIPPEFDFSGSDNLESATVLYPAPHRTKDKAGENIAYKDHVVLPVAIVPQDKSKPVTLKVKVVYGVCKDICIPAEAELSATIPVEPGDAPQLAEALAMVPVVTPDPMRKLPEGVVFDPPAVIDPAKHPALIGWRIERSQNKAKLVLDVKDPGGSEGDAFLFSADGLYMPMTQRAATEPNTVYEAELTEGAALKELAGKQISVTLTGEKGQSETIIQLPKDLGSS
jgi:DsbC/DsbD-like thiol-disulfide interchange protein